MDMVEEVKATVVMEVQAMVVVMTRVQVLVMVELVGCMAGEAIVAVVGTTLTRDRDAVNFMQVLKLSYRSSRQIPLDLLIAH